MAVITLSLQMQSLLLYYTVNTSKSKVYFFYCYYFLSSHLCSFAGTLDYTPPEWFLQRKYHAGPATVWSVGVTLYSIVSGFLPFSSPRHIIKGRLWFDNDLSPGEANNSYSSVD